MLWILLSAFLIILLIDFLIRPCIDDCSLVINLVTFIYTLSISYIASFIFYFVQVHIRDVQNKQRILPSVEQLFYRLDSYLKEVVIDSVSWEKTRNTKIEFDNIIKDDFTSATNNIRLEKFCSVYQGDTELTWLQYFSVRQKQIEDYRRLLLDYAQYIDEEGITLLADIRNDNLLNTLIPTVISCKDAGIGVDLDLSGAKDFCEQFFDLAKTVDHFYKTKLAPYKKADNRIIEAIYKGEHKQIVV